MAQKFVKTLFVSTVGDLTHIKPGQWIETEAKQRGQYLGTTQRGVTVIRWQNGGKFQKVDAINNHNLREYAKVYGSV